MQDFIKISRYAGMRNDLAQAGGGNTSVKLDDHTMLVKSSGCQLADVDEQTGYSKVDYRKIVDYFKEQVEMQEEDVLTEEIGKRLLEEVHIEGGRASIETFLHAVTGKYTLHSHPMLVNILTVRAGGMDILHTLFPKAVFVPYRKPGAALAETYYKLYRKQQAQGADGTIIFLANHGLVVSGDDADTVIGKTEETLNIIAEYLCIDDSAYREATALYQAIQQIDVLKGNIVYVSENRYLSKEYAGTKLVEKGIWEHAFCPDCVVYANKKLLWLEKDYEERDILDFMDRHGIPTLIYYEGNFYILAESVKKAQEIENVMSFAARVQCVNLGHKMNYLSDAQEDELLNWDAEKYRRQKK
ncbi:MAG: class II aldolase/adducin family protein [Lachnospiraceae bacterium]|nr:class II aldolase/adducin family protein [Lachnospiraceae bacterium]